MPGCPHRDGGDGSRDDEARGGGPPMTTTGQGALSACDIGGDGTGIGREFRLGVAQIAQNLNQVLHVCSFQEAV